MPIVRRHHNLDATGQTPGRLATQIATLLIGKNKADYQPNLDAGDFVRVSNAGGMVITGKKMDQKMYRHHTGTQRGGLKEIVLKNLWAKDPTKVLRLAVSRMLPKNRLRTPRLKRLTISK